MVILSFCSDMESVDSADAQKVSTLKENEVLLALDLRDLLYYHFYTDMSMDMESVDTPERPVMDSIIKVCCKGGNGLL